MTIAFDLRRLKSVKLVKSKTIRPRRRDLFHKFRLEANRVVDDMSRHSPMFNRDRWEESFISQRISQLPRRAQTEKMAAKARHFISNPFNNINKSTALCDVSSAVADIVWQGILMLEDLISTDLVTMDELDAAINRYWELMGLA